METIIRNKPKFTYNGLSIVQSFPSRFDRVNLLSANGGVMFNNHCLRPEMNSMQCDVRIADDNSAWLEGTKVVVLLGEYAMHKYLPQTRNNTIGEMRGSVFQVNGLWFVPTFFPQDAVDIKNYEKENNPNYKHEVDDSEEHGEEDFDAVKTHGRTSRKNYPFWMRADLKKAKHLLKYGQPPEYPKPVYHTFLNSSEVVSILQSNKGQYLYFDMEGDYEDQNLQCFSFSFDGVNIYNVPILDHNYHWAYSAVPAIMAALAEAIRDNTIVAHNGAAFDFFILGQKYHIPVRKSYDTMLAMHRCFPDIERSLGHCTSLWTWEPFHKDEDSSSYLTEAQVKQRMLYCGKDVYTMALIHRAIETYAKTIPGLQDSIKAAMDNIRPYLTVSLLGIAYDAALVAAIKRENDELMMQYLRIINLLIGESGMKDVQSAVKSKPRAMPASNPQCCKYFHDLLGYPVVNRGKLTQQGTRNPSLAKKNMFKLRLKHDNPVIDFCLLYRQTALETSTPLGFLPWRDDKNDIIDWRTYENKIS